MESNWIKFVQINIYGKDLKNFEEDGISLQNVMNNVGCDKVWIGEVSMYKGDMDSGCESSYEDTVLLNTTFSEHKVPRSSTPMNSIIRSDFTLCASKMLSPIQSETSHEEYLEVLDQSVTEIIPTDESFVLHQDVHKEHLIISNMLRSVIDIVCETEIDNSTFFDCGNASFAIPSEKNDSNSKTTSNTSDVQPPILSGPHPAERHSEYVSPIQMKPTIERNKSLSNLKIASIPVERVERKPLMRTTSEIRKVDMIPRLQNTKSLVNLKISNPPVEKKIHVSEQSVAQVFSTEASGEHVNNEDMLMPNMLCGIVDPVCETEFDNSTFYDCGNDSFSESSDNNQPYVPTSPNSSYIKLPTLCGPHPAKRHSEYVSPVEIKPILKSTKSWKNLKIESIPVGREKRKPLKRTTSEIRKNRRKAMKLIRNNTINPELVEIPELTIEPINVRKDLSQVLSDSQTLLPVSDDSVRLYTDLTPVTSDSEQYCEIERNFFDMFENEGPSRPTAFRREPSCYSQERDNEKEFEETEDSLLFGSERFEQESWSDQPIGDGPRLIDEHPQVVENLDDSLLSGAVEDDDERREDEEEEEEEGEDEEVEKNKKASSEKRKMNNTLYNIVCKHKDCKFSLKWRPKFGKLRLLDHVLSHTNDKLLRCHDCDYNCQTSRQIRYHYLKEHEKKNVSGYGILDLQIGDEKTIVDCWKTCYEGHLDIVGDAVETAKRRRKSHCEYETLWKQKYGTLKLLDHVLLHHNVKLFKCDHCGIMKKTTRQMKYHNRTTHKNEETIKFNMKRILTQNSELRNMWDICYSDSIPSFIKFSKDLQ